MSFLRTIREITCAEIVAFSSEMFGYVQYSEMFGFNMFVYVWMCLNMFRYDCMCLDMFEYV